jgi:hypothetical protein
LKILKKKEIQMQNNTKFFFLFLTALAAFTYASPCGAVLYRENSSVHYSYFNVPEGTTHHYFGLLEGPAWENKYCTYRTYVDSADRNSIDFIVKYKPIAILQNFNNPSVDEHSDNSWGTDCFSIGSSMGLGAFRLFYNNQWLNPRIGKAGRNLDSMVISIADSSQQTPKVKITYYGWNIGSGKKITVVWTISTTENERPTHCEVTILGEYTGKVVIGLTNNNKRGHPVTLIQDSTKAILATLGRQGAKSEGFTDTMLLAAYSSKKYFSSFSDNGENYGLVLSPDENKTVQWSFVYSMALETSPFFRSRNWQDSLFAETKINGEKKHGPSVYPRNQMRGVEIKDAFTISGKKLNLTKSPRTTASLLTGKIIIVRDINGVLKKTSWLGVAEQLGKK